MNTIEFKASDGTNLFIDTWTSKKGKSENAIFILHGFGEHGGRYQHLPEFLGDDFSTFFSMDQRGHGRSSGIRGHVDKFDLFLSDLKAGIEQASDRAKGKNIYLLAHSFGGLVGVYYLLKEKSTPFKAAVISAPLLGLALKIPSYKKVLGDLLVHLLPRFQLSGEVNPAHLSHDPLIVEAYVKDRLVHNKMTPKMFSELNAAMAWVRAQEGPLACRSLFIIPGADTIVDSKATIEFFKNLKDRSKSLAEFPHFFHESMNEIGKEKVFSEISRFFAGKDAQS